MPKPLGSREQAQELLIEAMAHLAAAQDAQRVALGWIRHANQKLNRPHTDRAA